MPVPPTAHALVLAAGLGTRLQPLTSVRAKPAIPLAGQPMVRRIVEQLAGAGVVNITVNLHHLPQTLTAVLGDGSDMGARVRYSWEHPKVLGSAGGPRRALDIIGADTFFIVNGDTLTDVPLGALADAHDRAGALVTLALVPNEAPEKYGGVILGPSGDVIRFVGPGAKAHGSCHFVGVQVAHRRAFEPLPPDEASSSIGGRYEALIAERPGSVRGFVTRSRFWDIGTVADYWRTSQELSGLLNTSQGASGHIAASAHVTRSIVWDDVAIEAGAWIEDCIVTDGVVVAAGAVYRRSILLRGAGGDVVAVALPENAQ